MIRVWRLCQVAHRAIAFSGEGARRYGGRWNRKGRPVVYTAATQSLAALEILVHVDTDLVPNDFVAFAVDIPEFLTSEHIRPEDLAPHWRDEHPPLTCQALGTEWLGRSSTAVLRVPSAIIPAESNYLLNPDHEDFAQLRIHPPERFVFDPRLW